MAFLKDENIQVLVNPLQPNLFPCHFWLFHIVKEKLAVDWNCVCKEEESTL